MKNNNLLMIGVGAVVLYFVWKKFGNDASGENVVSAVGNEPCNCMGHNIGNMSPRKCSRMCRKATIINIQ